MDDATLHYPKSHLGRQPETRTKHALQRRYVPDVPNVHLPLFSRFNTTTTTTTNRLHLVPQLLAHQLTDLDTLFDVIVALRTKAVYVHERQSHPRKELFAPGVHADEGREEGDGAGGEVEDVVGECFG